eukprot:6182624-Pleurochrysis_carterae.AAC.3
MTNGGMMMKSTVRQCTHKSKNGLSSSLRTCPPLDRTRACSQQLVMKRNVKSATSGSDSRFRAGRQIEPPRAWPAAHRAFSAWEMPGC